MFTCHSYAVYVGFSLVVVADQKRAQTREDALQRFVPVDFLPIPVREGLIPVSSKYCKTHYVSIEGHRHYADHQHRCRTSLHF